MKSKFQILEVQLQHALTTLWKRRWLGVAVAWLVAMVSTPAVLLAPNRYEAAAQVYVDTQTVLKPLLQGLAYTPDIDQQVKMLARTLISRPNVEQLVARPDLGLDAFGGMARERLITRFMDSMRISAMPGTTNLYSITYRDTDSARARRIVEATIQLFVNSGAQGKKRDSEDASRFIDDQLKVYEAKLVESENRLKDFKLRNFGISGVSNQDHFARMSALSEEVAKLRIDLASTEQSRDAFKRELAGENPQLPVEAVPMAVPAAPSEIETRLEAQKRLLDELLRKYTDVHPDVVTTRRLVAQLEAQRRLEMEEKAAQAAGRKGLAATSPVYQRLRVSLAEAEAQVASLRSQLNLKEARLNEARKEATRIPQVEADLAQLNRDYDVINKQYQGLVARRETASLGVKLDESSGLAEFRVVEPARVNPSPVAPSRLHLALATTVAAILLGFAAPLVADVVFPTFRDSAALARATGRQVLGSISMTVNPEQLRAVRTQGVRVLVACGGLLVLQFGWLAWLSGRLSI